jgi:hypothetical protein
MRMAANRDEDRRADHGYRDDQWKLARETACWRRRFLIGCAGVVALGVCAWFFPGVHAPADKAASGAASASAAAALARSQLLPSVAYGSAWVSPKTRTCAPADVVLSLATSQPGYAPSASPAFSVYAVSTASAPCVMAYGPGSVHVVVTRGGRVAWNSAACKLTAKPTVRFTRGVPQVLRFTWNRKAGAPAGCRGALPAGTGWTLTAVALGPAGESSSARTFTVHRKS